MAFGIGRKLKRAGRKISRETKRVGSQTEKEVKRAETKSEVLLDPTTVAAHKEVLSGATKTPSIPGEEEVTPIPLKDEELAKAGRRRSRARRRGGRSSSILTGDTLG